MPETTTRQARDQLHQLVEALPDDEVRTADRMLRFLLSLAPSTGAAAFWETLANAPEDDEPLTDADREAIAAAAAEIAAGVKPLTTQEILDLLSRDR